MEVTGDPRGVARRSRAAIRPRDVRVDRPVRPQPEDRPTAAKCWNRKRQEHRRAGTEPRAMAESAKAHYEYLRCNRLQFEHGPRQTTEDRSSRRLI